MDLLGAATLSSIRPVTYHARPRHSSPQEIKIEPPGETRLASLAPIPAVIAKRFNLNADQFDDIPWRRIGIGVWHHPLPLPSTSAGDLRLLKIAPGRRMPEHSHGGVELTLVLDGAYTDECGTYKVGDVQEADDVTQHRPVADRASGCICLVASDKPPRFTGLLGRIAQPFVGF